MRVLFSNQNDPVEAAQRQAIIGKIDAWWAAFRARQADIVSLFKQRCKWDLHQWMHDNLQAISEELMYEFGPAVGTDGHRLVITPETHTWLRPLVDLILYRAPKLPGWEFYPYRLPEPLEQAQMTVEGRTNGSLEGVQACAKIRESGLIDLTFFSPRCSSHEDRQTRNDAFVACESLLGEENLDKWIGGIEVSPMPQDRRILGIFKRSSSNLPSMFTLDRLKPTVDALIGSILEQLPAQPVHSFVDQVKWSILKLKPKAMPDYPHQFDLFVAKTPLLRMWSAAHGQSAFYSERYSKCGEVFCYVKLDGSEGLVEEKFKDKSEIEDALEAALKPSGLGCVIGGGTGLKYSYIDLALTDVKRGLDTAQRILAQGQVPKRSWIQFYDCTLSREWVGIYGDSPEPPLSSE